MITSSWYVYITEVNLNSDSLGGIQLRVGRKPYKCLISFLSILAGFLGIEDGLGMLHLTFCQWEWIFRTPVPLLKTAPILYLLPPESGAAYPIFAEQEQKSAILGSVPYWN